MSKAWKLRINLEKSLSKKAKYLRNPYESRNYSSNTLSIYLASLLRDFVGSLGFFGINPEFLRLVNECGN